MKKEIDEETYNNHILNSSLYKSLLKKTTCEVYFLGMWCNNHLPLKFNNLTQFLVILIAFIKPTYNIIHSSKSHVFQEGNPGRTCSKV